MRTQKSATASETTNALGFSAKLRFAANNWITNSFPAMVRLQRDTKTRFTFFKFYIFAKSGFSRSFGKNSFCLTWLVNLFNRYHTRMKRQKKKCDNSRCCYFRRLLISGPDFTFCTIHLRHGQNMITVQFSKNEAAPELFNMGNEHDSY